MQVTKTKKENAEVVLSGALPAENVEKFYDAAVKAAVKEVELPGFRKGHVPPERVIEEVGKNYLWKEAAERALKDELEGILKEEQVSPIAPVSLSLKSPEHGKDVVFEITVTTPPSISIADYKEVAKNALATLPKQDEEKEYADAKRAFRTQVRAIPQMQNPDTVKEKEGSAKKNEAPDATAPEEENSADEPLTDEEAKAVGFENGKAVEHFIEGEAKKAVAERGMQRRRGAVAEALIKAATYEIPKLFVDEESKALLGTFKQEVKAQGMEWNDYLGRVKKTEEEVKKDLAPNAEKRIALDLIFGNVIREEKLELDEKDKKKQEEFAKKLVEQGVDEARAKSYAAEQFLREKAWEALGVKNETPL